MSLLIRSCGNLQCLWRLGRFSCSGNMTGEELLKMLASNE